jgi:DNA polymerase elongation subunit (family B)
MYVEFLYSLRKQYSKSHPLNLIAKILLNSLYGRFGMSEILIKYDIITREDFEKIIIENDESISDFIELDNHVLVGLNIELQENSSNISIGVAAAITAYARIHMSQFKNNLDYNLYYSDTDSIYIDKPLPDSMISNTILGKLKLEYILTDAIFLAPKVYYLETEDGKIIYKIKGLKHEIELTKDDFENLLFKESFLEKLQTK